MKKGARTSNRYCLDGPRDGMENLSVVTPNDKRARKDAEAHRGREETERQVGLFVEQKTLYENDIRLLRKYREELLAIGSGRYMIGEKGKVGMGLTRACQEILGAVDDLHLLLCEYEKEIA